VVARRAPVTTYRQQLTPDFGFGAVAGIAGYLADLGVTHVYLSPILEATPGSAHGYDVTDHSRVRAEFGGEPGFRAMARALNEHAIGTIVDIVPNHMAVPAPEHLNRQLWSVLRDGRDSQYAHWFDIEWSVHEGRMLMPMLAGPLEQCLDDLVVDPDGPDGSPVLRYFDHVLPLWPGTARLPMMGLLESQHYKLADWRTARTDLNWRRFFDVTSLIAIRAEEPDVFDATHEVILRLAAEGLIDGLRVDHPDGLADPRGYFGRLAAATGGMWMVAEKILAWGERLPGDWPVAGTTGYDTLGMAGGLFVDPAGAGPLTDEYARFTTLSDKPGDGVPGFTAIAATAKREVVSGTFGAEVARLARLLPSALTDAGADAGVHKGADAGSHADVRIVLAEFLAAFEVYRAYVYPGEQPSSAATEAIRTAESAARDRLPGRLHPLLKEIAALALNAGAPGNAGAPEFAIRLQQTTGPVLAKGVEDTAFYRWPRLISLNEVGGDPGTMGLPPAGFHAEALRLQRDWPGTMTTLSTHDTKRQEDVRARLAVLAEIPREWGDKVAGWHARIAGPRAHGQPDPAVDLDTEYFIWQTFVGAWPLSGYRLSGYMTKAIREAKLRTSWTDPDPGYEAAVHAVVGRILGDEELIADIRLFIDAISPDAMVASLGAKLVQLTMPGVPDVYQGCELGGLSLVDPDNRRPVDYDHRRRLLTDLDEGQPVPSTADAVNQPARDIMKMRVTSGALRLRAAHPDWFTGPAASYTPMAADGPAKDHVIAFARASSPQGQGEKGSAITIATRLPVGLRTSGGWAGTTVPLPDGDWRDVLTGAAYQGGHVKLADLTARLPVALLEKT
jgi:(1->4)-alpha-D-glucan 1-alpha-D-glucosylmutase